MYVCMYSGDGVGERERERERELAENAVCEANRKVCWWWYGRQ